jgi:hypothetical protein
MEMVMMALHFPSRVTLPSLMMLKQAAALGFELGGQQSGDDMALALSPRTQALEAREPFASSRLLLSSKIARQRG